MLASSIKMLLIIVPMFQKKTSGGSEAIIEVELTAANVENPYGENLNQFYYYILWHILSFNYNDSQKFHNVKSIC